MKPKRRLVRGKDWHAWAWQWNDGVLEQFAELRKPNAKYVGGGRWVRVKFVRVK